MENFSNLRKILNRRDLLHKHSVKGKYEEMPIEPLKSLVKLVELEIKYYPKNIVSSDYYTRIYLLQNVKDSLECLIHNKERFLK